MAYLLRLKGSRSLSRGRSRCHYYECYPASATWARPSPETQYAVAAAAVAAAAQVGRLAAAAAATA